jgi:hypothetical protein
VIATLATFLIGLGGIAVDLVLVYTVKTFLATATDSAAMGGIRALERGVTYADQATEVQRVTDMLFDSNFPNGVLLTGNSGKLSQNVVVAGANMDPTAGPMFADDPDLTPGMREIRVLSEAKAPTFFMRIFGVPYVEVRASAYAARRDVNVVVVIDRSGSLKQAGAWDDVQNAAVQFIQKFDNNRDRVGVVTFGSAANVDFPLDHGFKTNDAAKNLILSQIVPDGAATNYPTGLWLAYAELLRVNDDAALNSIVFFTDGQPSAFSASFRMRTGTTGPRCTASQQEGALAAYQYANSDQFHDIVGLWKRQAGPPPVNYGNTSYDWEMSPNCTGLGSPAYLGPNVEGAFDPAFNWPSSWTATEPSGISRTFCIQSGAVGCDGIAGDFTYSISDSRLYNNDSTTSNKNFRGTNLHNASKNLALNIAEVARQDGTLGGVNIHAIGLGGWGYPADTALMKRIANDNTDSYGIEVTTSDDEPHGYYVYAPTAGELQAAFDKVRSEVMRLTR